MKVKTKTQRIYLINRHSTAEIDQENNFKNVIKIC